MACRILFPQHVKKPQQPKTSLLKISRQPHIFHSTFYSKFSTSDSFFSHFFRGAEQAQEVKSQGLEPWLYMSSAAPYVPVLLVDQLE
jgi:hypothetical protein